METVKIKQATAQGYIECEVGGVEDLSFPDSKTRRGRVQEKGQVSPTLMAGEQDICRIETVLFDRSGYIKETDISNTLTANDPLRTLGNHNPVIGAIEPQYRIRKLTPKECWRLMDFLDDDFNKAAQVNSPTQLYTQAGNSICRNVLVAIIGQMLEGKEDEYKKIG